MEANLRVVSVKVYQTRREERYARLLHMTRTNEKSRVGFLLIHTHKDNTGMVSQRQQHYFSLQYTILTVGNM